MLYNSRIQNQITNNYRYFDFHRNKGRNEKKENRHDEEKKDNRKCVRFTWEMCVEEPQWILVKNECITFPPHRYANKKPANNGFPMNISE